MNKKPPKNSEGYIEMFSMIQLFVKEQVKQYLKQGGKWDDNQSFIKEFARDVYEKWSEECGLKSIEPDSIYNCTTTSQTLSEKQIQQIGDEIFFEDAVEDEFKKHKESKILVDIIAQRYRHSSESEIDEKITDDEDVQKLLSLTLSLDIQTFIKNELNENRDKMLELLINYTKQEYKYGLSKIRQEIESKWRYGEDAQALSEIFNYPKDNRSIVFGIYKML